MQGIVGDGRMRFTAIFNGNSPFPADQISTKLYLFGTARPKTPKPKQIMPMIVSAGGETTVSVSHRFALPGCVARLVSVGTSPSTAGTVSIRKFYFNEKYLEVVVNAPVGASGQYRVEITNPDGRKANSKRFFTVQ